MTDRDADLAAAGIYNLKTEKRDVFFSAVPNVRARYGANKEEDQRIYTIVSKYDDYPNNIDYLKALALKPKKC